MNKLLKLIITAQESNVSYRLSLMTLRASTLDDANHTTIKTLLAMAESLEKQFQELQKLK